MPSDANGFTLIQQNNKLIKKVVYAQETGSTSFWISKHNNNFLYGLDLLSVNVLCVFTEQVCKVLARHVGTEGIRRDARSQREGDGCTRLHLKRTQTVQSWSGRFVDVYKDKVST